MLKSIFNYATLFATAFTSLCFADSQTTFEVGVGYRRDFFKFRTSEVPVLGIEVSDNHRLKDLDIFLIDAEARIIDCWYYFRAKADYGWVCNGNVQERFSTILPEEVIGDNVRNRARGNVADLSVAIGYPFEWCCGDFAIAPIVGYSWHTQRLHPRNRNLIFTTLTPAQIATLAAAGVVLDPEATNRFRATWYGPFVGFDAAFRLDDCWTLYGEFEFHFAQCRREHRFLLLPEAEEVEGRHHHRKRADGFVGTVGTNYFFACDWYAGLQVDMKYWRTKRQRHDLEVLGSTGDHVRWSSVGLNLNLGYLF